MTYRNSTHPTYEQKRDAIRAEKRAENAGLGVGLLLMLGGVSLLKIIRPDHPGTWLVIVIGTGFVAMLAWRTTLPILDVISLWRFKRAARRGRK